MANNRAAQKTVKFVPRRSTMSRPRGYPRRSHKNCDGYSANKPEIFGPVLLVATESTELYQELLQGLIRDLNPIGTAQCVIVEKIATNFWRQRRLIQAERAEIMEAATSKAMAIQTTVWTEAWDAIRQPNEILRNRSNALLLRHAITHLKGCRDLLDKNGFQPGEDPWRLRELYGLAQNKFAPRGLFEDYMRLSQLANDTARIKRGNVTVDEMKAAMLADFDKEIEFLEGYQRCVLRWQLERAMWAEESALVPSNSDRLVRQAKYLSEELDSLFRQLERLQRT